MYLSQLGKKVLEDGRGGRGTHVLGYCLFQKPLTVPTRAPLVDAGIGSLEDGGRLSAGGFSNDVTDRGTFGGMREGGIGSLVVGDVGPGLARAGACRDCVAITFASLAGGLNLAGAWGILERTVGGDGRDALPGRGSLDGAVVALGPGVVGVLRLFGLAVNLKIDFDLAGVWPADALWVGTAGSMPAADARDVRLLGAGRCDVRDVFAVAPREARNSAEAEVACRDALWNDEIVDADCGMGGNGVCIKLARDATLGRDDLGAASTGTMISAGADDSVGEVGNGGTSSKEEAGGR